MFGHDDKDENKEEHVNGDGGTVVQPISTMPPDESLVGVGPASTPVADDKPADTDDDEDINKIVDDINASTDANDSKATPSSPTVEPEPTETETEPAAEPADAASKLGDQPTLQETPAELLEVKKSALQELSPLLDELDQPADEKLNILMMTIQATDDQALLPQALETAKKIEDKKARAEAMLDIIQEINYFTKKQ